MLFRTWRRRSRDQDLDQEIQSHVEMSARDRMERGEGPEQAAASARRQFGNIVLVKEATQAVWGRIWLEQLGQDSRYAIRMMRRNPCFAAVAVLSLAVGIGANATVFSAIDALVLRMLPVRSPGYLVMFSKTFPYGPGTYTDSLFAYPDFERFRGLTQVFSGASAICDQDRSNVTANGAAAIDERQVRVGLVTGNYFSVLGVDASIGRTFGEDDDRVQGGHPLTVISYGYWERMLGLASDVVGRNLTLEGTTYSIIGVTPRGFYGDWVGHPTDFWIPVAMASQVMAELPSGQGRAGLLYRVVARLRPGVDIERAQAAGQVLLQQLMMEAAGANPDPETIQGIAETHLVVESAARGYSPQRSSFARPLAILTVVVGAVLLIACANVASLLLARAAARRGEMAVRLAIGAGRIRIVRQLLTESLILTIAAGAAGLLLAWWGTSILAAFMRSGPTASSNTSLPLWVDLDLHPGQRILAFTTVLCLLTGILFGLVPALQGSKASRLPSLAGRGANPGGSGRRFGLRKLLVISQVALSLVLLVSAGLFSLTLWNLKSQDLGLDRGHVLLVWTQPGQTGRQVAQLASLWQIVQERISSLPGVISASPSLNGMLRADPGGGSVRIQGYAPKPGEDARAQRELVGPGFFKTVGQRLLRGRDFTLRDTDAAPRVVIINESIATYFFRTDDPIGKRLIDAQGQVSEIVGVVSTAKYNSPRETDRMMFYCPYRQQLGPRLGKMCLAVRAAGSPASIASSVRQELCVLDPTLPVLRINSIEDQLTDVLFQERLMAGFTSFFGTLAVLLACLGLYGIISYSVARRTNEIGIRLALGATRRDVSAMVVKESMMVVAAGIAIGLPAALAATRLISANLFGVTPTDPVTIAAATLLMIAVAALAGFLPAHRASRLDPMTALRYE